MNTVAYYDPEFLADFIESGEGAGTKVLAYLLRNKDELSMIHGTQREIAKEAKVSIGTVIKVFKALRKTGMLIELRCGLYELNL